ncbi:hypothetical protein DESUT3_27760 [Desulfuromonas versatilis]|uniref:LbtU family siderophore porin n=1 Tax=Desulfuromonas versatilis TaxID=2802975 RepID=A0ABM8HY24_9BACT|nr:LbtU family siderophore porin [Desulfuromonas versatilis]BCR05707.1 hypothetical protein DESUT3_27760 [Desulfuromonas versatilis]
MFNRVSLALLAAILLIPAMALAHGNDGQPAGEQGGVVAAPAASTDSTVEKRMSELEARQAELYHTLAEKKTAGLASQISERLTISGLIEVEAVAEDVKFRGGGSEGASDLTLATAQLGFDAKLTEAISGNLIFLFEEDGDEDIEVDEAAISFNHGPWNARVGRQYVPFGVFNSHFISDPLTLELGESRETALLAGWGNGVFGLSAFAFNGDAEKQGEEDHLRDWGASLVLTPVEGLELGASYLSDLADTDAELLGGVDYRRRVGGWSAFAVANAGPFELSGEILGAVRSFAAGDLDVDGDGSGDKPLAWNLELAWYALEALEFAARVEGSDEFADQPELQYGVGASWGVWENTSLSLEYLRGEFDPDFSSPDDAGRMADRRHLVTAQLAYEF